MKHTKTFCILMLCVGFTKPGMGGGCVYVVMGGMSASLYGLDGLLTDVYTYSIEQAPDP